jgi:hypothetical protein
METCKRVSCKCMNLNGQCNNHHHGDGKCSTETYIRPIKEVIDEWVKDEMTTVGQWTSNGELKIIILTKAGTDWQDQKKGILSFMGLSPDQLEKISLLTDDEMDRILKIVRLKNLKSQVAEIEEELGREIKSKEIIDA